MVSMLTITPACGQRRDHGPDPAQFLVLADPQRAWPGRLAADVHDVGTARGQLEPVRDGLVWPEPLSAVGEGIRGHVDHAHDQASGRGG